MAISENNEKKNNKDNNKDRSDSKTSNATLDGDEDDYSSAAKRKLNSSFFSSLSLPRTHTQFLKECEKCVVCDGKRQKKPRTKQNDQIQGKKKLESI